VLDYYAQIKLLHIACVVLSGSLFALRGVLMLTGSPYANHILAARLIRHRYHSDVMKRIAAPLVGGMLTAPPLSLILFPVIYECWQRGKRR
jgi:Cu/Ag efflux pump CusA